MPRTRSALLTTVCTVVLTLMAGPAFAGPAPLVPATEGSPPASPIESGSGSDIGTWTVLGYTAAALAVVTVLALAAFSIVRHMHQHAPHAA